MTESEQRECPYVKTNKTIVRFTVGRDRAVEKYVCNNEAWFVGSGVQITMLSWLFDAFILRHSFLPPLAVLW